LNAARLTCPPTRSRRTVRSPGDRNPTADQPHFATTILHTLPDQGHASGAGLADELLATIDSTAVAGSLHRGHLALDA
jgi:hypothetical protein